MGEVPPRIDAHTYGRIRQTERMGHSSMGTGGIRGSDIMMGKVMQNAPGLSANVWQRSACDLAGLLKLSLHIPYGMGSI